MTRPARRAAPAGPPLDVLSEEDRGIPGLRQRRRADGSWRLWWEPTAAAKHLGFAAKELDAARLTWSLREARRINGEVRRAREGVAMPQRGGRTVSALIRRFEAPTTPRWAKLAPATQRDYGATFRRIERKWGAVQVAAFTKPIVYEWYEALYHKSGKRMAQHEVRVLSLLLSYAERIGWIQQNPCIRLGMETPRPRDRVVSWEEFDALLAAARVAGRAGVELAIAVAWYQGQRQADVIAARIEDFAPAGDWRFERSKARAGSSQKLGVMPVHPELRPMIEARRQARGGQGPLILSAEGAAYRPDNFRHDFARIRAAAAKRMPSLKDVMFRDLRRSWSYWAREGGADARDRADGMGNQSDKDVRLSQTYNPPSYDGAKRAIEAVKRPGKAGTEEAGQ